MKRLFWLLIPLAASAHPCRYARLSEFDGTVQVRIQPADQWQPAARNLVLPEGARVQTGADSHAEIELDQGGVLRLTAETLAEISDYTQLSGGQRITLLSLDHGVAYFTGQAGRQEALMMATPGAQVTVDRAARVRLEGRETWSQIAALEGKVRFASPSAELDLREGEMVRVDPVNRARFYLYREIAPLESDPWSDSRDKALASTPSAAHVPGLRYGVQDLDAGSWIDTEAYGAVWKPKVSEGWAPFRDGKWVWYDGLGYTWVANEKWGWLPFHYGRWASSADIGWFWVPGRSTVFKPGDVYWLQSAKLAGWGPLALHEESAPNGVPQLFLNANTTWAEFTAGARAIDPAGFTARPKDPLAAASFTAALPSPPFSAARLDIVPEPLRAGAVRILPVVSGVAYEDVPPPQPPPPAPAAAPAPDIGAPAGSPPVIVAVPPPEPPVEIYFPVQVNSGVVVVNPPGNVGSGGSQPSGNRPGKPQRTGAATPTSRRVPEHRPITPGDEHTRERPVVRTAAPSPPEVHADRIPEHHTVTREPAPPERIDKPELTGNPRKN